MGEKCLLYSFELCQKLYELFYLLILYIGQKLLACEKNSQYLFFLLTIFFSS